MRPLAFLESKQVAYSTDSDYAAEAPVDPTLSLPVLRNRLSRACLGRGCVTEKLFPAALEQDFAIGFPGASVRLYRFCRVYGGLALHGVIEKCCVVFEMVEIVRALSETAWEKLTALFGAEMPNACVWTASETASGILMTGWRW